MENSLSAFSSTDSITPPKPPFLELTRLLNSNVSRGEGVQLSSYTLAGRAIWLDAFNYYPDWDRIRAELEGGAVDYMADISGLADTKATNWASHSCYGSGGARFAPDNADFRHQYSDFGEA